MGLFMAALGADTNAARPRGKTAPPAKPLTALFLPGALFALPALILSIHNDSFLL